MMPTTRTPESPTPPALDPEAAWAAVLARDARLDGRFVYAVASTGVYCRPTCPSRRPRRDNVRFFGVPEEAEREGYRPCRRCRPRREESPRAEVVRRACAYLAAHLDGGATLADLAREVGMSPYHLQRTFKAATGLSPKQYAARLRAAQFKSEVQRGESVSSATYGAGYGSSSRLYEAAGGNLGMTPGAYRRGGLGMRIRFTALDSPFGRLLVGATERGICAVLLGEDDAALEAELRREYPRAAVERDDEALRDEVAAILPRLDGSAPAGDLPLDLQATAFQWQVWRALQEIPRGETRTYRDIAAALGRPRAVRAVAQACASNRVALVVPCHRVVRSDGEPGGYRWGAERKRRILDREAEAAHAAR